MHKKGAISNIILQVEAILPVRQNKPSLCAFLTGAVADLEINPFSPTLCKFTLVLFTRVIVSIKKCFHSLLFVVF